jgi:WD40 repeat protein
VLYHFTLWRIGTDKVAVLLDGNMGTTNGIEVSQDEKRLYVNESAQLKIWRFDLNEKGEISNKTLFASFTDFNLDGMRCDTEGNLYVTRYGKGVVAIFSPDGVLVREVPTTGKEISNIAFGGIDGRTCFVTLADRKMVEMFRTETAGREWKLTTLEEIHNMNRNIQIVYPNPATSILTIGNLKENSGITVVELDGREISKQKAANKSVVFDVSNWKKGMYLLYIRNGNETVVKKAVIQ